VTRCANRRTWLGWLGAIVVIVALLTTAAVAGETKAESPYRVCRTAASCTPDWTSPVLVYAVDTMGAAVAGALVTADPPTPAGPGKPEKATWVTDWHGLAALSLEPQKRYRLHIKSDGFRLVTIGEFRTRGGDVGIVRVTLEVDVDALQ
jgi:hypothetical protein